MYKLMPGACLGVLLVLLLISLSSPALTLSLPFPPPLLPHAVSLVPSCCHLLQAPPPCLAPSHLLPCTVSPPLWLSLWPSSLSYCLPCLAASLTVPLSLHCLSALSPPLC